MIICDKVLFCIVLCAEIESGLGRQNGCVVFALFSRAAKEEGELSLCEGERLFVLGGLEGKWWKAKNGRGQEGEVPSTFLGPYKQTRDTL